MSGLSMQAIYEPLDVDTHQLRLLVVEPGHGDDTIHCSLRIESLDAELRPVYETISYCWGDAPETSSIIMNGKQVLVPITSLEAVKRMRLSHRERTLWIDAICIDQKNVNERGSQVAMMGMIYRKGEANLIYLGSDSEGNADGIPVALQRFTDRITGALRASSPEDRDLWTRRIGTHLASQSPPLISAEDLLSIAGLYASPWFTRLWVVQEAYFAVQNTCYWGDAVFSLEHVLDVSMVSEMPAQGSDDLQGFIAAGAMWRLRLLGFWGGNMPDTPMWFQDLFFLSQSRSTSDPRDHVYAMYDLLTIRRDWPLDYCLLTPDYRKSTWDVYRDATKAVIQSDRQWILGEVCHRSSSDLFDLPKTSWTVSWNRDLNYRQDHVSFRWSLRIGAAGASPGTWASLDMCDSNSPNILVLRGLDLGPVAWATSSRLTCKLDSFSAIRTLLNCVYSLDDIPPSGQILSALLSGGWHLSDFESAENAAKALRELLQHLDSTGALPSPGSTAYTFYGLMRTYAKHRCFFRTGAGHLGSGPKIMESGDRVIVFHGGLFPCILRPTGKDDGSFFFVGNALIPGIMRGEALGMGLESRTFCLR